MGFKTGQYIPSQGKCLRTKIVNFRSSYEETFCHICDFSSHVVRWEYEQYYIAYRFRGKTHHYLLDFFVELDDGRKYAIEIKPASFAYRALECRDKNHCKWEAAINFCNNRGWTFKVISEKTLPILAKAWR